ncbi:retention module-containing protein, partial [Vibrio sp. Of7-15]|uniref:retention module-containing protein n=1 Tax=Vibrio sp. Of7-15 TaxID=2724879 RepID=UPI001EF30CB4
MQSIVVAAISGLNGNNVVIDKDGNIQFLQEGMTITSGDVLITDGQGRIEADDDTQISVESAGITRITEDGALEALALDDDIAQIFEALESGQDPTQLSEEFATAAGGVQGSSLTTSQAIERTGAETLAQTAFDTASLEDQGLSQTQSVALAQALRLFSTAAPVLTDDGRELDAPKVSIIDGGDDYLNNEEVKDGIVEAVITLPDRTDTSTDVLVVDFNDGNGPQEFPLNELTITDGTVTLPIPVSELVHGNTIQIDVQVQVPSGGLSDTGSDTTQVDLHVGTDGDDKTSAVSIDGITEDRGESGSDFVTNDNTLVINGKVELATG